VTDLIKNKTQEESPSINYLVNVNAEIEQIHRNLSQTVIITTEDKLRLTLDKHVKILRDRQDWLTPASVLLATLTTLITADFQSYIVAANIWEAIFIIISVVSFAWLIWSLNALRKSTNIDIIISELKPNSIPNQNQKGSTILKGE